MRLIACSHGLLLLCGVFAGTGCSEQGEESDVYAESDVTVGYSALGLEPPPKEFDPRQDANSALAYSGEILAAASAYAAAWHERLDAVADGQVEALLPASEDLSFYGGAWRLVVRWSGGLPSDENPPEDWSLAFDPEIPEVSSVDILRCSGDQCGATEQVDLDSLEGRVAIVSVVDSVFLSGVAKDGPEALGGSSGPFLCVNKVQLAKKNETTPDEFVLLKGTRASASSSITGVFPAGGVATALVGVANSWVNLSSVYKAPLPLCGQLGFGAMEDDCDTPSMHEVKNGAIVSGTSCSATIYNTGTCSSSSANAQCLVGAMAYQVVNSSSTGCMFDPDDRYTGFLWCSCTSGCTSASTAKIACTPTGGAGKAVLVPSGTSGSGGVTIQVGDWWIRVYVATTC
jgi:hypothetical protein